VLVALAAVLVSGAGVAGHSSLKYLGAAGAIAVVGYLVWRADPAYTLSLALFLSPIASHWQQLGIPGAVAPDRLLLIGGIGQVLLRAPAMRNRPRLRFHPSHGLLALATLWALSSAFFAHTLFTNTGSAGIIDSFGILPFLAFLIGPVAFRTHRSREALLVAIVALGAYLGLTTVFEMTHINALVFPRYILNPTYGIHYGKGRGPFVDAVANGFACFVCTVGCAIALYTWRRRGPRWVAAVVAILCIVGTFLSLERSVWIGAVVAIVVTMFVTPRLRRYVPAGVAIVVVSVGAPLLASPALRNLVQARLHDVGPVYDRENLTVAAVNMIKARPITGFGWERFQDVSTDYFRQSQNYPLTATTAGIHNYALFYAVGLGLPGATLWAAGLLVGIGSALLMRGPPELAPWRVGLLAIFVVFVVVSNSVPPTLFQNLALWLWAGVVFPADRLVLPVRDRGTLDGDGSSDHAVHPAAVAPMT
jgi:putative inorganic carbon (hco3(-)) transporter